MSNDVSTEKKMSNDVSTWSFNDSVISGIEQANFVASHSILLAAGPRFYTEIAGGAGTDTSLDGAAFKIGFTEDFSLAQNKQIQRIFEIGSKRSRFVTGRTINAVSLGTVFYNGKSLMRVLQSYNVTVASTDAGATANAIIGKQASNDSVTGSNDNFWLNLGSTFMDQPFGLLMWLRDRAAKNVGAVYLEDCNISGHNMRVTAGSILVMEGVSIEFDQIIPIGVTIDDTGSLAAGA